MAPLTGRASQNGIHSFYLGLSLLKLIAFIYKCELYELVG